ncbi:hypothetical protein R3P38DRAFT_480 [Favolaschia claudopus]|uniref:Uncharacterized protein n=1 Tax=Favolaschia claudopus TaxID=2862362 RepID=A0AAW0EFG3_9AGAR
MQWARGQKLSRIQYSLPPSMSARLSTAKAQASQSQSAHSEERLNFESTPGFGAPDVTHPGGTLFSNASNFNVNGGTFIAMAGENETKFENFPRIPLGHIVLGKNLGIVKQLRQGGGAVRRVHSAKMFGERSPMTVVIYEGHDAQEDWHEYIAPHLRLRHENVFQLFATCANSGMCAAVFHGGVVQFFSQIFAADVCLSFHLEHIPIRQAREGYRLSPTHLIYFHQFLSSEFYTHAGYIAHILNYESLGIHDCTFWLERSGKLHIELSPSDDNMIDGDAADASPNWGSIQSANLILPPEQFEKMMHTLTFDAYYYGLLDLELCATRIIPMERTGTVRPFSVVTHIGQQTLREVAFLVNVRCIYSPQWEICDPNRVEKGCLSDVLCRMTRSGWTRGTAIEMRIGPFRWEQPFKRPIHFAGGIWITQAGYVFQRLRLDPGLCSFIDGVSIGLHFSSEASRAMEGAYVFLPPCVKFFTPDLTHICSSIEQPYWSFDPLGKERLSGDQCALFALPTLELQIAVRHVFFDTASYEALCTFHRAKGLGPHGLEAANRTNYPNFYFGAKGDPSPSSLLPWLKPSWPFVSRIGKHEEDDDEQILYPRRNS